MRTMMGKRNKRKPEKLLPAPEPKRVYQKAERFVAKPCNACPSLRAAAGREDRTRVYSKHDQVRWCICENCGATWPQTKSYVPPTTPM